MLEERRVLLNEELQKFQQQLPGGGFQSWLVRKLFQQHFYLAGVIHKGEMVRREKECKGMSRPRRVFFPGHQQGAGGTVVEQLCLAAVAMAQAAGQIRVLGHLAVHLLLGDHLHPGDAFGRLFLDCFKRRFQLVKHTHLLLPDPL